MKSRKSVFDSNSERRIFFSLESRWSPRIQVFPNLPLSKVLDVGVDELKPSELSYFYKTNVDYTVTIDAGLPILCVEFDGIGGGFSREGLYVQAKQTVDPNRKSKLDFKLRLANSADFPLIVISFGEVEPIFQQEVLTILDGVIGQILAQRKADEMVKAALTTGQALSPDLLLSAQIRAELQENPITKEAGEYMLACLIKGISLSSTEFFSDPPMPTPNDFTNIDDFFSSLDRALKGIVRVGCKVTISSKKPMTFGPIWVRNFEGFGISPTSLAQDIAEYLAFKHAYKLLYDVKNN